MDPALLDLYEASDVVDGDEPVRSMDGDDVEVVASVQDDGTHPYLGLYWVC